MQKNSITSSLKISMCTLHSESSRKQAITHDSQCVTTTKTTKTNDENISLSLNPKHEQRDQNKISKVLKTKHEMCKTKVQTYIYCNEINKCKHKNKIKQ
jgi:hypothetical protein